MTGLRAFGNGQSHEHFRVGFIECVASHGFFELTLESVGGSSSLFELLAPVASAA
ncbi:hypothetical protein [Burkholderia multivorans]|jgi:hypothetical protein|uniref:hypothetical protein n=1 Tax=Burkholderia multivorans TaxID=87883 RepID=UPI001C21EE9F|nr:hypothetical protein [Burkholderia multivorans]MBU9528802.1 hypothetical protein [Burkholderia multivorans]MBU9541111.1 hypothetical protein [Burkholderia multivorans]MBU9640183.1 hypothetical protein [Burkholderia multivorans]HEF4774608.1 hypothetical protein [Burkholderia multivorans]